MGTEKQEILLHEGVNVINVKKAGNVYVDYFADDPDTAPAVTIHFVTGKVNGYFDATVQSNEDWNRLLDNAVSPCYGCEGEIYSTSIPCGAIKKSWLMAKAKELAEKL